MPRNKLQALDDDVVEDLEGLEIIDLRENRFNSFYFSTNIRGEGSLFYKLKRESNVTALTSGMNVSAIWHNSYDFDIVEGNAVRSLIVKFNDYSHSWISKNICDLVNISLLFIEMDGPFSEERGNLTIPDCLFSLT